MRLFIALMLVSLNVFALDWYNLDGQKVYKLKQPIQLQQIERSRSFINLNAGDRAKLIDVFALDQIKVTMFRFNYLNCPGRALKTDMEIVPVKNTNPVVEIGAQIAPGCLLEVFIENKDLQTNSIFE